MKGTHFWILAAIITLAAAYYQRKTGPTRPKRVEVTLSNTYYTFNLPRTHGGDEDFELSLVVPGQEVTGRLFYRRYPTGDAWTEVSMVRENDVLKGILPYQPPAGKLAYYLRLESKNESVDVAADEPVIIRFKGDVPGVIMGPHILLMFIAMLLSNLAGLFAMAGNERFVIYGKLTLVSFFLGGMILGPLVQYHAFGDAWTGIPFGWDLTDNKTLISFIFWIIAVAANRKRRRPVYTILAALILLVIYSIPHSLFGSEYDYVSGEVTQGVIHWLLVQ